jgi:asparagine synthase (glutamine-hydrolysing)
MARSGLVPADLSEDNIIRRMFRIAGGHEQTVFKNIRRVLSGQYLRIRDRRVKATRYWNPRKIPTVPMDFHTTVKGLREHLIRATTSRMEGGITGLHISGGLDSSGVASIVADHTLDKRSLIGYTWTPEVQHRYVEGVDERPFIEALQREKGILVKYLNASVEDMLKAAAMPDFEYQHIELPVMQQAQRDGVDSIFSGWGGDELVSIGLHGYYNYLFYSFRWLELFQVVRGKAKKKVWQRFNREVVRYFIPFLSTTYHPMNWRLLRLIRYNAILRHFKLIFFHRRNNVLGYGSRKENFARHLENYHIQLRIESWAIHGEKHGIEYKYPLLDKETLEYWFSIPVKHTYHQRKPRLLFRESLRETIPELIRLRADKSEAVRFGFMYSYFDAAKNRFIQKIKISNHNNISFIIDAEIFIQFLLKSNDKGTHQIKKYWNFIVTVMKNINNIFF